MKQRILAVLVLALGFIGAMPDIAHGAPALLSPLSWPGKRHVDWTPDRLQVMGLTGTDVTATASFTAGAELDDATISAWPNWVHIADASLSQKHTIQANTPYTVPLDINIPATMGRGERHGVVEIRTGHRVYSRLRLTIKATPASAKSIPQTMSLPSDDRIASDGGMRLVKDELLVDLGSGFAGGTQRIEQIAAQNGAVIMGSDPSANLFELRFPAIRTLDQLKVMQAKLQGLPDVRHVSKNFLLTSAKESTDPGYVIHSWAQEYIKLPAAWDITTGDGSVPVGVIDDGFAPNHEDLRGNIKSKESLRGPMNDPGLTGYYHGTHVAGVLCADGNNGVGMAGVNWKCDLHLYSDGTNKKATIAYVLAAMRFAVADKMRIINMSVGLEPACGLPEPPDMEVDAATVNDIYGEVLTDAKAEGKDILWVFAAGNGCRSALNEAPAGLAKRFPDNTIAVAAIGKDGRLRPKSNFGSVVSVAAPGEDIYSTTCWPGGSQTQCANNYAAYDGTSAAAPFVAGLASLAATVHPDFSAKQLKDCIIKAATIPVLGSDELFKTVSAPAAVNCDPHNEPCAFGTGAVHECTSTDPSVSLFVLYNGDTSGCLFSVHADWGDGTVSDYPLAGSTPSTSPFTYASHVFQKPGTYRIDLTGSVTSGSCTISDAVDTFTLLPS